MIIFLDSTKLYNIFQTTRFNHTMTHCLKNIVIFVQTPNIVTLLNGVLIPTLLNSPLLLVNNNLWRKLVSSSPMIFDDNLKTTSDSFYIADLNLLSCEFDSFTFKLLYCVIFILIKNLITKLRRFLVKSPKQFLLLLQ